MKSSSFLLSVGRPVVERENIQCWFSRAIIFSVFVFSTLVFTVPANAGEWDGAILWGNKAPLGTPVSGVVTVVNVAAGDFVKRGSVLLKLDDRQQQADVLAQRAELKRAGNESDEAARELERTQELYDRTLLADHDLEVAVIHRDAAVAKYQTTKSRLVRAEMDLEYTVLKAPFDAWVLSRDVAVGQVIVSRLQSTPLFELVQAGFMLARISVPAEKISSMHKKKKASIYVAGKKYSGQISHVALEPVKPGSDEYVVDVMFNSGKTVLRSGMAAKVNFN